MSIEVRSVAKSFGAERALDGVSLSVPDGRLVALLGPSGSGKTTLLRVIAGLELADAGEIRLHGRDVGRVSVRERRVGFVFQHYALFRHMSVFDNVAFGLRVMPRSRRPARDAVRRKVERLLELVQLSPFAAKLPGELSGGQRQRVALARALAVDPQVLLLDEPFGALDAKVRHELRRWLRTLHEEIHVTSLFVTHDQEEALEVADEIVVMNEGRIEQAGTPDDVYHRPANEFVMGFLGRADRFDGTIERGEIRFGPWRLPASEHQGYEGPARAWLRPHDWEIDVEPASPAAVRARVVRIHAAGALVRLEMALPDGTPLLAELSQRRRNLLELEGRPEVWVWPRSYRTFTESGSLGLSTTVRDEARA